MPNNNDTLLRVEHLCQHFSMGGGSVNKAVDDVSFEIKRGEVFGLVGESGCGKTTIGRSIIGLYDITDGNVYFKGIRIAAGLDLYKRQIAGVRAEYRARIGASGDPTERAELARERDERLSDLKGKMKVARNEAKGCEREYSARLLKEIDERYLPLINTAKVNGGEAELSRLLAEYKGERRRAKRTRLMTRIQMIFQDPASSLDPRMTVREIVSEGLVIRGERDVELINKRVYDTLELVGLGREHAGRYPHEFSGGQQQRIGIARAIIMEPELIIADEPVSALDVSIQAQVINLLNDLRDRLGLTILFVAHDLSVVKYFSDRIGVMYLGRLVELADSEELFRHPLHPYTKSLLSAIPLPDPISEKGRKRIVYNALAEHDYTVDPPTLREVTPGHFVYCNGAELLKYIEEAGE